MISKVKSQFWIICSVTLLLGFIVFLRTAWISDDAMITFRYVQNILHGNGAVFNIGERVQGYTHPLWFLLLTLGTWIFGNMYTFVFCSTILISLCVLFLLLWNSQYKKWSWIWVFFLLLSKAFIDFSTSGLENPLSHIMLVIGVLNGFKFLKTYKPKYACISLTILFSIYLSRPDLALIVLPFCIFILSKLKTWKERYVYFLCTNIPNVIWTIFSLIYYGFPFPNTAYAKLNNGIPKIELIHQGFIYFLDSFVRDPLTLVILSVCLILSLKSKKEIKTIALGILLYLFYIIWIGGDFMSGRFFTAPLVLSILILTSIDLSKFYRLTIMGAISILGIFSLPETFLSNSNYTAPQTISSNGITNERGFWFQKNGLFSIKPPQQFNYSDGKKEKSVWRTCGMLGELGMREPLSDHIMDLCGLTDPLLARIPPLKVEKWRPGHFFRQIPTNYEYYAKFKDDNYLLDNSVYNYIKPLKMVISDPIFSTQRFTTIFKMNAGLIKKPSFSQYATDPIPSQIQPISRFNKVELSSEKNENSLFNFIYSLQIDLEKPTSIYSVDLSILSSNNFYIQYFQEGKFQNLVKLEIKPNTLNRIQIRLPNESPPVSQLLLVPISKSDSPIAQPKLGHFYINTF